MRYRAQVPTHSFAFVGAEKATATTEVIEAIADADIILLAPSNPVVSVGAILAIPGIRGSTAGDHRPDRRLLADHRRKAVARHGRCMPARDRGGVHRRGGGPALRRARRHRDIGRLAGATTGDSTPKSTGSRCASVPLLMSDPEATAEMVSAGLELAGVAVTRTAAAVGEHGTAAGGRDPARHRAARIPSRRRSGGGHRGRRAMAA